MGSRYSEVRKNESARNQDCTDIKLEITCVHFVDETVEKPHHSRFSVSSTLVCSFSQIQQED